MRGYTEFFLCVKVSIVKTTRSREVARVNIQVGYYELIKAFVSTNFNCKVVFL
jgi:hypothetical protein